MGFVLLKTIQRSEEKKYMWWEENRSGKDEPFTDPSQSQKHPSVRASITAIPQASMSEGVDRRRIRSPDARLLDEWPVKGVGGGQELAGGGDQRRAAAEVELQGAR